MRSTANTKSLFVQHAKKAKLQPTFIRLHRYHIEPRHRPTLSSADPIDQSTIRENTSSSDASSTGSAGYVGDRLNTLSTSPPKSSSTVPTHHQTPSGRSVSLYSPSPRIRSLNQFEFGGNGIDRISGTPGIRVLKRLRGQPFAWPRPTVVVQMYSCGLTPMKSASDPAA
ncbi:hypothetical protein LTR04_003562 [Oleoguttula sp. CCFEE 6159]|nr:hypothetical protein LTR04_003562 [Oleoguttula sp. CCFEE 6159]